MFSMLPDEIIDDIYTKKYKLDFSECLHEIKYCMIRLYDDYRLQYADENSDDLSRSNVRECFNSYKTLNTNYYYTSKRVRYLYTNVDLNIKKVFNQSNSFIVQNDSNPCMVRHVLQDNVQQLKNSCKENKIKGYSKLKRSELIALLFKH